MALAFYREESAGSGLRRMATELLDDARFRLAHFNSPDKDIHETRKNVKKLRAILRLGRFGLGDLVYRRDNEFLRDLNRTLALMREAFVHIKLLNAMQQQFEQLHEADIAVLKEELEQEHQQAISDYRDSPDRQDALARLDVMLAAVSRWPEFDRPREVLRCGLEAIYGRGREELAQLQHQVSDEHFHDWRKRVKYLWYHLRMMAPAWPQGIRSQAAILSELAELLGDDHDLAVFHQEILHGDIPLKPAQRKALINGLVDRRRDFAFQAIEVGKRLYVESPEAFSQRIMAYWDQWQQGVSVQVSAGS